MPIDTSMYANIRPVAPVQLPNPLEMVSTFARVEDVLAQAQARRLAGDKARQQAADEAQIRSVMAASGDDIDEGLSKLATVNPRAWASLSEQVGKARKEKADAVGKDLENQKNQLAHYLNVWGLVKDDASLTAIRPLFVKSFPQLDAALPTEYGDGTAVQRVSDAALTRQQQIERNQKALDLFAKGEFHAALGNVLSRPDGTAETWDQGIKGFLTLGGPKAVADEFGGLGGFSEANVANAARLAIPAAKREELAGQKETREQTAANQAATQANQAAQLDVSRGHLAVAQGQLAVARQRLAKGTGTNQDREALMQAVIEQPGLWDQITPTERGHIAGELNARGFTGFGKPLGEGAITKISESKSALASLVDLKDVLKKNEQYIGPIAGLQALNPYSEANKAQADINLVRQRVGKALEGGVLRKEDEEKYKQILATLRDTPSTAIYKVDQLIANVQRDIDTFTHEQRLAGRRVMQDTPAGTTKPTTRGGGVKVLSIVPVP